MKKKNEFISVIITNFNKEKYIINSLKSIINQDYNNFEIIVFDDCSTDNSINLIKKFKNVKLIENKKKEFVSGPLNQINGIIKALSICKGKIICLLDSDDKFEKNKLKEISNFFLNNSYDDFVVNFPQKSSNFTLKRVHVDNSIWPSIFPTSCISFRKPFFLKFKKRLISKNLPNLEIDARLMIYAYHHSKEKKINIINKKLTKYVKSHNNISSYYSKFSINWWHKRKEAFDYLRYILQTKNKNFIRSLDFFVTNMIYFLTFFKKN